MSLWITLLACVGTGGCQASGDKADAMPARVTPPIAASRIGQALPDAVAARDRTPAVRETTPAGLFDALATQTFRVEDGVRANDTFAVTADEAVSLGTGYGGPGIVAFHLGDIDGNGAPDLAYAYGSGSGITRFEVGIYDRPGDPLRGQVRTRRVPLSYRNPLRFQEVEGGLEVWDTHRNEKVGLITAAGDDLRFVPVIPLPQGVRERLLEPRQR
jgi:hypothetical protein